jgi:hypothetical protein
MTIDPREAASSLDDIAGIERRMREALFYGGSSNILIAWGIICAIGHCITQFSPRNAGLAWLLLDAVGVAAAVVISVRRARQRRRDWNWRFAAGITVTVAFGLLWQWLLGDGQWREVSAFWATLIMFTYILAGLWVGRFFVVCGIVVTALTLVGYFWSGAWFELWMAAVFGGSLVAGGLWLRRVGAR